MITSLSNFSGIQLEMDIAVITLEDNMTHTYFSKFEWEKDNSTPIGMAKITMPYDEQTEKYWSNYHGTVVLHANLNDRPNRTFDDIATRQQTQTAQIITDKTDDKKIRLQNDEYNYSFIGKVHKIKQVGKNVIIYLEDLGWKFLQKVPDKFRKTYIAGQTLDNAFQAICEFMGIEFAYSIEDLSKYNFAADGYSIEKDGSVIEEVPTIFEEFKRDEEETEKTQEEQMADNLNSQDFEAPGLIEVSQQISQQLSNQSQDKALNKINTNEGTNTTPQEEIVENPKTEMFQEEFDRKIEDLFKGNTLYDSNVSSPILNYNWVTIQQASNLDTNSTMQTNTDANTGTDTGANTGTDTTDTNNNTNEV